MLGFDQKIYVTTQERWEDVSLLYQKRFKMLSCTNQFEPMHGHLNGNILKLNEFYK